MLAAIAQAEGGVCVMPIIYEPPQPHRCTLPRVATNNYPVGTVWQCSDCSTYWVLRYTDWGPTWTPLRPRPFDRKARAAIKQAEGGTP